MPVAPKVKPDAPVPIRQQRLQQGLGNFTATELAAFVHLRQCGRYLRLTQRAKQASSVEHADERATQFDEALAAAGRGLQADVVAELRRLAPYAPGSPLCDGDMELSWRAFMGQLASAAPPQPGPVSVGCWAEEVALRGLPTADSVASVSGRADFIVLLWRGGVPVLRIVECKASSETHTKHLAQLVLYRMLLLRLLRQEAAERGGRVVIGGRGWAVPQLDQPRGRAAALPWDKAERPALGVEVECVLRNKAPGGAVDVVAAQALAPEEVAGMTYSLAALLAPGGRVATALDAGTTLHCLPFELDSHCGQCPRAPACWADAAARGAVQLSGCSADQAQRLAKAGVADIEDLAHLGGCGPALNGRSSSLDSLAAATGIQRTDLRTLALTAAVRVGRRLGPTDGARGSPQAQPCRPPAPQFLLLPGAAPSCLPDPSQQPLVGVFLTVATDAVLHRVVGVAAHVAPLRGREAPVSGHRGGPPQPQRGHAGWDVVALLRGVQLDEGGSCVADCDERLDELERGLLSGFSERLCGAIACAAAAAAKSPAPEDVRAVHMHMRAPPAPALHFYVHSHAELRALLRRCLAVEAPSAADAAGSSDGGAAAANAGGASAHSRRTSGCTLAWLPHLLGMRAAVGEQDMVSVMEDEVRRYATIWQGAGREAACSMDWGGCGAYEWGASPAAAAGAAEATAAPAVGGSADAGAEEGGLSRLDLRALFSASGYLNCLQRFDPRVHRALGELPASAPAQAQQPPASRGASARLVQIRPDAPGSSIPPSYFRALWSSDLEREQRQNPLQQQQQQPRGHEQQLPRQAHQAPGGVAAQLEAALLAQARAVRWLAERMARLPLGCNPRIDKPPLSLQLGPELRTFRLGAQLAGPRNLPPSPHVPLAAELARAGADAVRLDRAAEVAQFWRQLGGQPPAARAAAGRGRGGTLVLGRVHWVAPPDKRGGWLRGRVLHPEGCASWEALCQLTGLEDGAGVLVSAADDPWVCQDAAAVAARCALGVLKPDSTSGATGPGGSHFGLPTSLGGSNGSSGGGLWVECHTDPIRYPPNGDGQFVRGADSVRLSSLCQPVVVLDAAPNISAWVASSTVEALQEYGTSSGYLAQRLRLPQGAGELEPEPGRATAALRVGAAAHVGAPGDQAGPATPPATARTPVAATRCGGGDEANFTGVGGGTAAATPGSVMGGQALLLSPTSPAASSAASSPPPPAVLSCSPAVPQHAPAPGSKAASCPADAPAIHARAAPRHPPVRADAGTTGSAHTEPADGAGAERVAVGAAVHLDPADGALAQRVAASARLHPDQLACVRAFLSHPGSGSRVLLQGPPGTGKTEAVALAVLAWLAACMLRGGSMGPSSEGGVVLVNGPTHTAIDTVVDRVAQRLLDGVLDGAGEGLAARVKLVRLGRRGEALTPLQWKLKAQASVPSQGRRGTWYVVGGTLRQLVKEAGKLRTLATQAAIGHTGRQLLESSGRGACACALVLDEASMVLAPQLLALGGLLVTRGSLLVAGDHQQLGTITQHDFARELRPNLLRHAPHVSAYDYMRLLAAAGGTEGGLLPGGAQDPPPPPVAVCALTHTHRLPAAVTKLISPLYLRDGITLQGRPAPLPVTPPPRPPNPQPAAELLQPFVTAYTAATAAAAVPSAFPSTAAVAAARRTPVLAPPAATAAVAATRPHSTSTAHNVVGERAAAACDATPGGAGGGSVWQRLWAAEEGVFLVAHNEEGSGQDNPLEAELVCKIMAARPLAQSQGSAGRSLNTSAGTGREGAYGGARGGGGGGAQMAIITPHRAQRRRLQALAEARRWDCRVDTVERMQGGEADSVIFCATVSDAAALERSSDFYASLCRANVAFSRTRRRLIVIASRVFLAHLPASYTAYAGLMLWRQLRLMCEVEGRLLGEALVRVGREAAQAAVGPAGEGERGGEQGRRRFSSAAEADDGVSGERSSTGAQRGAGVVVRSDAEVGHGAVVTYRCDVFEGAV